MTDDSSESIAGVMLSNPGRILYTESLHQDPWRDLSSIQQSITRRMRRSMGLKD